MKIKSYIVSLIVVIMVIAISGTPVASAAFLSIGSRGGEVADLQITLLERGFDIPAISSGVATPGYFGTQTQKAVSEYQRNQGYHVTGSIDSSLLDEKKPLKFGSVTGPDTYFDFVANNDLQKYGQTKTLRTSTTTTCAIRSPANATSTGWGGISLITSTTTAY